jgi:uncharacterized membrane protein
VLSTLWGASYSFIKVGVQSIPPVTLIAVRTLIAGALLLLVIRWRGVMLPRDASSWQRFFIQACLNSVVPFTLMAWAQQTTDATLATILNSTSPIFAFMLTALVARHEVVTRRRLFGVGAGFVGICLIVGVQALCRLQLWVRNWTTPELPVATVASWPRAASEKTPPSASCALHSCHRNLKVSCEPPCCRAVPHDEHRHATHSGPSS